MESSNAGAGPAVEPGELAELLTRCADALDRADEVDHDALQRLIVAVIQAFARDAETDPALEPFPGREAVTPTELLRFVSRALDVADIEMFELAMWKAWAQQ